MNVIDRKTSADLEKLGMSIYKGGYIRLSTKLVEKMKLEPGSKVVLLKMDMARNTGPVWGIQKSDSETAFELRQAVKHNKALIFNSAAAAEAIIADYLEQDERQATSFFFTVSPDEMWFGESYAHAIQKKK